MEVGDPDVLAVLAVAHPEDSDLIGVKVKSGDGVQADE